MFVLVETLGMGKMHRALACTLHLKKMKGLYTKAFPDHLPAFIIHIKNPQEELKLLEMQDRSSGTLDGDRAENTHLWRKT